MADISHLSGQKKHEVQSKGAGLLLEKVLALCFDGKSSDDFEKSVGKHGKPLLKGVEYNLSHSGDLAVCAISDKPVGCDVEKVRRAPEGVANRFFSNGEKKHLSSVPPERYDEEFFRIWTLRESYVKMTGEGLGLPLGSYEIIMGEQVRVIRDGQLQECYMKEFEVDGYRIAVCGMEEEGSPMVWESI